MRVWVRLTDASILNQLINMMAANEKLISAREASRMLGIRLASLYAYVSRGQIRALPDPADPRARLYRRDDIEALLERKSRQSRPAAAAATALDWGMPVLTTHLSSIGDGRLAYRGRDAVALAETAPLEEIAALLWDCEAVEFRGQIAKPASAAGSPIDRAVAALAGELPAATPTAPAALRGARAGRLIRIIAVAAADRWLADGPLTHRSRRHGRHRRRRTPSGVRWCWSPITSSTHRPSRPASPPRRARRCRMR